MAGSSRALRSDCPASVETPTAPAAPCECIEFETGNPDAGTTLRGQLSLRPVTGTCALVCIESVPGLMTSADFCMFVRPFHDALLHIRLLRPVTERNRYMVVALLKTPADASNFARVFQGKHYLRGLIEDTCSIREISSCHFYSNGLGPSLNSPQSPSQAAPKVEISVDNSHEVLFGNAGGEDQSTSPATAPKCAVCLEVLERESGALVTTLCNHTLHAACMAQCNRNSCPVCRHAHELTPEATSCMNCANREDIWMCVVCAYVGCGVYKKKHAYQHFIETQHPFAINLEDLNFWTGEKIKAGSVWDYISERFVNRLIFSDDGKVVELGRGSPSSGDRSGAGGAGSSEERDVCCSSNAVGADDIDDVDNDRAMQAAVYASRMDALVDEYRIHQERMQAEHAALVSELEARISTLEVEVKGARADTENARRLKNEAVRDRKSIAKRLADVEKEQKSLVDKNEFLKNLNESLLRDKAGWKEQVDDLTRKLNDTEHEKSALEEQLRDVMMHLETQAKIASASADGCRSGAAAELSGADVVRVGPSKRERLAIKLNRRVHHGAQQ